VEVVEHVVDLNNEVAEVVDSNVVGTLAVVDVDTEVVEHTEVLVEVVVEVEEVAVLEQEDYSGCSVFPS